MYQYRNIHFVVCISLRCIETICLRYVCAPQEWQSECMLLKGAHVLTREGLHLLQLFLHEVQLWYWTPLKTRERFTLSRAEEIPSGKPPTPTPVSKYYTVRAILHS